MQSVILQRLREEEKRECEKLYWQQKELVKHLVRKEFEKHEKTLRQYDRKSKKVFYYCSNHKMF